MQANCIISRFCLPVFLKLSKGICAYNKQKPLVEDMFLSFAACPFFSIEFFKSVNGERDDNYKFSSTLSFRISLALKFQSAGRNLALTNNFSFSHVQLIQFFMKMHFQQITQTKLFLLRKVSY